jgi:two-component system, LytTR family, response regulator
MTVSTVTLIVADDERPARRFLIGLLKGCPGAQLIAEATSGEEALALIQAHRPHLALLDLQMPEMGGLEVVRRLPSHAYDDHAIEAFELNAIDYLLKPVQRDRLQATIDRARQRIERRDVGEQAAAIASAATAYERAARRKYADRLPLRQRDKVVIVPVRTISSIVSEGELLHITTGSRETYTITHPLHALEARLDPRKFIRLGRSILANIDMIAQINPMPGGTYIAVMSDGQELSVSRIQSRTLRETLLKL